MVQEILDKVTDDVQVVAIDEVQFFNSKIVDVCEYLADKGVRVMVAGLDKDFRGEAFGVMPELLTKGEFKKSLQLFVQNAAHRLHVPKTFRWQASIFR